MDLLALNRDQWHQLTNALWFLWLWVPLMVSFAFCLMTALAVIPSMVQTRHLSRRTLAVRPALLVIGMLSLVGAVVSLASALFATEVLTLLYPRWLI